jgi:hypothetical protein
MMDEGCGGTGRLLRMGSTASMAGLGWARLRMLALVWIINQLRGPSQRLRRACSQWRHRSLAAICRCCRHCEPAYLCLIRR